MWKNDHYAWGIMITTLAKKYISMIRVSKFVISNNHIMRVLIPRRMLELL